MSYSASNRAWNTLQRCRNEQRRNEEIELAQAIVGECPTLTWGQAIQEAVRILATRNAR